jgi:pilus assembly protein CpaE
MTPNIRKRILIVQDRAGAEQLRQLLNSEGYELFDARTEDDAFEEVLRRAPDLAIIELDLPNFDGLTFCRRVRQDEATRDLPILVLTSKVEIADKVAGYEAGIDDYITKPFAIQELVYRIRILIQHKPRRIEPHLEPQGRGRVIALFGTKGGVGRTTVAVNLAVAIQRRTSARVLLFDADFFFGDLALHLNLPPSHTIMDLVEHIDALDPDFVDQVLITHNSGVRVLVSPRSPEDVESITAGHVQRLLEIFTRVYDYVIVDCQGSYDERTLVILERADAILLVVKPEVGCVKNMAVFSELAIKLGFPFEKIHIILNRAGTGSGIDAKEIERIFRRRIAFQIGSGGRSVVVSVNRGVPLTIEQPNNSFSIRVGQIADYLIRSLPLLEGASM